MRTFIVSWMIFGLLLNVSAVQAQSGQPGQAPTNGVSDVLSRVTKVKGLRLISTASLQAPSDAFCLDNFGIPCYSPQQIQKAYGLTPILKAGFTGAGQTIIIIDSFGSPTMAGDLKTCDADYGLPDPQKLKVLGRLDSVPFGPANSDLVGWAFEAALDVEWSRRMAPADAIVLLPS